jgi:diadenylate cyclase
LNKFLHILQSPLFPTLPWLTLAAVLDALLLVFLLYNAILVLRGRRAASVLIGLGLLTALYWAANQAGLQFTAAALSYAAPYFGLILIVLFQSEIRRFVARLSRLPFARRSIRLRELTDDLVLALLRCSEKRMGALIVLEKEVGLRTFIESGIRLDACISPELIWAIFHKESELHDGAIIVQRDRIAAANCFLPLSISPDLRHHYGTRHRAAIGVTEDSDCLALVVSEQTGAISVAAFGKLETNVSRDRLYERIFEHLSIRSWRQGGVGLLDVEADYRSQATSAGE